MKINKFNLIIIKLHICNSRHTNVNDLLCSEWLKTSTKFRRFKINLQIKVEINDL